MSTQTTPETAGNPPPAAGRGVRVLIPFVPIVLAIAVAFIARHYQSSVPVTNTRPNDGAEAILQAGAKAPDFSLLDALADVRDPPVTLSRLTRREPVLLVFYFSFSCGRCIAYLAEYELRMDEFRKAGLQVVAISADDLTFTREASESYGGFQFPLLSDPDGAVAIEDFGMVDAGGNALQGVVIIDTDHRVRFVERGYDAFDDLDLLLAEGHKLQQEKQAQSRPN